MKLTCLSCLVLPLLAGISLAAEPGALDRALVLSSAAMMDADAGSSGHDGKFFVASSDEAFRLNVGGQIQLRYNANFRDNTTGPDDDATIGFNTRRTKLEFSGHVYDKWSYKVVGAFSRSNGNFVLEDAILTYKLENGVKITWGQFKLPFLREESISSKYQLATDRSVANEVFNQDRSQALQISWQGEQVRVFGAVSDGLNTANTNFLSPAEADFALTARGELRFGQAGWKAFDDFTSFRGGKSGGLIGATIHWQSAGDTANTTTIGGTPMPDVTILAYTIDASYEGGGWNLYAAFIGRNTDTAGASDNDDFGAVAQGGVFISDQTELFARWDAVFPDNARASGQDFHTLTFGANHYFIPESHALKLTVDLQWFLDDQTGSSSIVGTNEGIALIGGAGDDEVALRFQMQLLF